MKLPAHILGLLVVHLAIPSAPPDTQAPDEASQVVASSKKTESSTETETTETTETAIDGAQPRGVSSRRIAKKAPGHPRPRPRPRPPCPACGRG